MASHGILQALATALGIAAELGFFNQWIFQTPKDCRTGHTALYSVIAYAVLEPFSWYTVRALGTGLDIVVVATLLALYMPATFYAGWCLTACLDNAGTGKEVQQRRLVCLASILGSGMLVVAASFMNSLTFLLLDLVKVTEGQRPGVVAYGVFMLLVTRLADLAICDATKRARFIVGGGICQTLSPMRLVFLMLAIQNVLSWSLGLGLPGPLEELLSRML